MRVSHCTAVVLAAAGAAVVCASAGGAGPAPGYDSGARGVTGAGIRYVAIPAGRTTLVEAIRMRGGQVLRSRVLPGRWGVPFVANDGSTGGLARDGSTLVLGAQRRDASQFAVLDTSTLRARQTITLRGTFSFDALSPNARTLYLIQILSNRTARYSVRAYDLVQQRLLKQAIVDKREAGEQMNGFPVSRTTSGTGRWVYTLYARPPAVPFVHALDAVGRKAVCIDLPWRGSQDGVPNLRLRLQGRKLLVARPGAAPVVTVDTKTFRVKA